MRRWRNGLDRTGVHPNAQAGSFLKTLGMGVLSNFDPKDVPLYEGGALV